MTRTWLLAGIAGASMLGLVATGVSAGFSGGGLEVLRNAAPASNIVRVHNPKHGTCRGNPCHRHEFVNYYHDGLKRWIKGWRTIPCKWWRCHSKQ
jgi:hypothetical protein